MPDEPYYGLALPPATDDIADVREAAMGCKACHLWRMGTQTVFGEGSRHARVMLVGEQPGDQEDRQGHPFVGPAGRVLTAALEEAGIDPGETYTTNAVKHFKWEPKGSRRIHKRPSYREVTACYPWLDAEIRLLEPEIIVCLGSTAAQALLGKDFKVKQHRGESLVGPFGRTCFITVHPSSILRSVDDETRRRERAQFTEDLRKVAKLLEGSPAKRASLR